MTESNQKLLWVSLLPEKDDRERRLVDLLKGTLPLMLVDPLDIENFLFSGAEVLVLNSVPPHTQAESIVERVLESAPHQRILLRSTLSEQPLAILEKYGAVGLLDAAEGPDLTRARLARAIAETRAEVKPVPHQPEWRARFKGRSHATERVAEVIRLVGPRKCTVLITGETGSGKEVVARAIHSAGPRGAKPFVAINCGAIPAPLLEAELFGHTRGAFTGAVQARAGRFEQAEGGTLFLDEIGDMPLELQAKLLRVLQERELQRLGSSETVKISARIIAATNCHLPAKVSEGSFRQDLFYRLNVVPLEVPPLRDRVADIRVLVDHFIQRICVEEQIPVKKISPETLAALEQYPWPGNVRQLENAIASAVILSENRSVLDLRDFALPPVHDTNADPEWSGGGPIVMPHHGLNFTQTVSALERDLVSQALRKTGGNKKAAAEMLQLKRTTLSAKIRVLELNESVA